MGQPGKRWHILMWYILLPFRFIEKEERKEGEKGRRSEEKRERGKRVKLGRRKIQEQSGKERM